MADAEPALILGKIQTKIRFHNRSKEFMFGQQPVKVCKD